MESPPATSAALAAAQAILALAQDQTRALYAECWDDFAQLAERRATLLEAVDRALASSPRAAVLDALMRAAAIDDQNQALLQALQTETERELSQLRQGHSALQGYGRPTTNAAAAPARLNVTG